MARRAVGWDVTTTPGETPPPPRFRLRTFGTLRLLDASEGAVLGDQGHQARRLALLAVLAAAGEQGRTRDQLLGLFWPDVPQSRARHSLEQMLYAIRNSLDEKLFIGVNPLRLNSALITSDFHDLSAALERRSLEDAVRIYCGSFLDGFYLADTPEFEQWLEAERARLERRYTDALEQLARRGSEAGDFAAAARWRQQLSDADPLSSKHATELIRALMNSGGHASALRYAERYEALVHRELGTSVGPAIAGLVADVRAHARTDSVVTRGATGTEPPLSAPSVAVADAQPASRGALPSRRPVGGRRAASWLGIATVGLAGVALAALWMHPQVARGNAPPRPTRSIPAYELYLRGSDPALTRSDSSAQLGVAYFSQSIALDSNFAAAHAGLSRMYIRLLVGLRAEMSPRALHALAEQSALRAVALNDSLAEAHAAVGAALMTRYEFAAAERELQRAVALDPRSSRVSKDLATVYQWQQRPAEALAEANRAVENDPLSSSARAEVALALCANGEYAPGMAQLKQAEAVQPPLLRLPLYAGLCHGMQKRWPAAAAAMRSSPEVRGRGFLGYALARSGERQQALAVLDDLMAHWQRSRQGAFEVAVVHAGLGDSDRAFEWLDRSVDDLSLMPIIMIEPLFEELHADHRFKRLQQRIGL